MKPLAETTPMRKDRHTVCAYLGVKNCPELLEKCLSLLLWADEIVVGDVSDNDRIERLCAEKFPTARYVHSSIDDVYRRLAAILPTIESDYILGVDSDEFYTPELAQEILDELKNPCAYDGFIIPSVSYNFEACWGQGASQLRLFHRNRHQLPLQGGIHAMPTVPGQTKTLKHLYHHYNNPKLGMVAVKHFRYEAINAARLSEDELDALTLHDLSGTRLIFHALKNLLRINVQFTRALLGTRRFGFSGLCHAYGCVFQAIASDVCQTEEWRMRKGLVERGNRGYF